MPVLEAGLRVGFGAKVLWDWVQVQFCWDWGLGLGLGAGQGLHEVRIKGSGEGECESGPIELQTLVGVLGAFGLVYGYGTVGVEMNVYSDSCDN